MFTKLVVTTILVGVALADTSESGNCHFLKYFLSTNEFLYNSGFFSTDEFLQSECDLPELPSFFFTDLSTLPDPLKFENFTLDTSDEEVELTTETYSFLYEQYNTNFQKDIFLVLESLIFYSK